MANKKPWERLEDETSDGFAAFEQYRMMGPERSLTKVARLLGCSPQNLARWSRPNEWVLRCAAFDSEVQKIRVAREMEDRTGANRKHFDAADKIIAAASKILDNKRATAINLARAADMLKNAQQIQRLAMGMPTTINKTTAEVNDAVQQSIAVQGMVRNIISEELCDDEYCSCCVRIRSRLAEVSSQLSKLAEQVI